MRTFYKILRSISVILLVLPLAVPALLYILLSIPGVQNALGHRAEKELTSLLGTRVSIGKVEFLPFTRIVLKDVTVNDTTGRQALRIGHLGAGMSLSESLWNKRPVITYAEIIDLEARLWRDSIGSPLNIDPIIARFKKKEPSKESPFDLAVNMVVIRRSSLTYDVVSAPAKGDSTFDASHISVSGIRADLRAPRISNGVIDAEIKRMGAIEKSGLTLRSLSGKLYMDKQKAIIADLSIQLPNSSIAFDNIETACSPLDKGFDYRDIHTRIALLPDAYISTTDITPLLPELKGLDLTADLEIDTEGDANRIDINRLDVSLRNNDSRVHLSGAVCGYNHGRDSLTFDLDHVSMNFNMPSVLATMRRFGNSGAKLTDRLKPLSSLGDINLLGQISATVRSLDFKGSIITSSGSVDIDAGVMRRSPESPLLIDGVLVASDLNPSGLHAKLAPLTGLTLESTVDLSIGRNRNINGTAEINIASAIWDGTAYSDITGSANFSGRHIDLTVDSNTPEADFSIRGGYDNSQEKPLTELYADIRNISLSPFISKGAYKDYDISAEVDASVLGGNLDQMEGWVNISDIGFINHNDNRHIDLDLVSIRSEIADSSRTVSVKGGPVEMTLKGEFSYPGLVKDMKQLTAKVFPALLPEDHAEGNITSQADLNITINPDTAISRFFKLPVEVIHPIQLEASTSTLDNEARLLLSAPYLKQKDKLIEETTLTATLDAGDSTCNVGFNTLVPTKNGQMDLRIKSAGANNVLDTDINWHIDRKAEFSGDISFASTFSRDEDNVLTTDIKVAPGKVVFNDSVWNVTPAEIAVRPEEIRINNLGASRSGQTLAINGVAGVDSLSRLEVVLDHIDLDYVFETLALSDAVKFGGIATGRIFGESLLSKDPILYTPRLLVDGLSYNNCNFGLGDIHSWWDNNTKTITIGADITRNNGKHSIITGTIMPLSEELDFNFSADEAPSAFMLPFMSAFTSKVDGLISGDARLFGTFKDLDLIGDIYVKDLSMKLDFTNTVYTVSDSVHITPGIISFKDVEIRDRYGNCGKLTGEVTHRYFHDPTFKFNITDVRDMLVYDVGEHDTEDPWYGRIYGSGSAAVKGVPGKIDIGVNMRTAAKSTFTFVLSDAEQSVEYDFITLRDRDKGKKDSIAALDPTPLIVRQLRERIKKEEQGAPTVYAMEFNVDITPDATLNLIMDPIGGDKITAHGSGHLRMNYASDGELEMYGEYTLNRGSYNFTLQDIIIKDFTILEGSKITFLGDPYAAQLNIRAAYSLNANLSDLDESFLEDRELTRTNVKVNAIMIVTGDMRQPDIKFDLEFPTLTADTYRKVRSIISTDEMMSRQIIYLLALNRFYTPEYMATTHGNELVSVASSTLSSRLGSMLGQLSDNWSIAPAIRSDRGDFSDVEVDVALSSQLLDNRLLFNGNLGYRDKSLNNNSFIGDFDIRYLLNRHGTIQLKAYNRYNDQNYYLKSALTTQGVGVVFKRDFDNIFSFLRPIKNKLKKQRQEKNDSIKAKNGTTGITIPNDTVNKKPTRFEVKFDEELEIKK